MAGMVSGTDSGLAAAIHVSGSTMVVPADMELVLVQSGKAMVMVSGTDSGLAAVSAMILVDVGTIENGIVYVPSSAMANDFVFPKTNAFG